MDILDSSRKGYQISEAVGMIKAELNKHNLLFEAVGAKHQKHPLKKEFNYFTSIFPQKCDAHMLATALLTFERN